jgi:hypothetical protein
VAHSNQALNDVFSKTVQRDVPARYLLRLGMGQEDLDTDVDFSRTGVYCSSHARQSKCMCSLQAHHTAPRCMAPLLIASQTGRPPASEIVVRRTGDYPTGQCNKCSTS